MIRADDLRAAIAECQGERNPNAHTCMKLAAYYTILREIEPDEKPDYSYGSSPVKPQHDTVEYLSDTEFSAAINGRNNADAWAVMDELMSTLKVIQPRLYTSVLRRLRE